MVSMTLYPNVRLRGMSAYFWILWNCTVWRQWDMERRLCRGICCYKRLSGN